MQFPTDPPVLSGPPTCQDLAATYSFFVDMHPGFMLVLAVLALIGAYHLVDLTITLIARLIGFGEKAVQQWRTAR